MVQAVQSDQVSVGWDDRVLATHTTPHFMQSSTWETVRTGGPWHVSRRGLGVERDYPALVFERLAEGFGILQHLPRVSGISPADVPRPERADPGGARPRLRDEDRGAPAARRDAHRGVPGERLAAHARLAVPAHRHRRHGDERGRHPRPHEEASSERDPGGRAERRHRGPRRPERGEPAAHDRTSSARPRSGRAPSSAGRATSNACGRRSSNDDRGRLYFAWHEGRVVAGAFVALYGPNAWYKDGGSLRDQPQLMASRLLQWGIIRDLAEVGIERYDLGHVPPPGEPDAPGQGILIVQERLRPGRARVHARVPARARGARRGVASRRERVRRQPPRANRRLLVLRRPRRGASFAYSIVSNVGAGRATVNRGGRADAATR